MASNDDFGRDDPFVREFARLARERLTGDAPSRDRQSFSRLEARLLAERSTRSPRPWARAAGFALAAAVLLGLGTWGFVSARRITFQVENAELAVDGKLFGGNQGGHVHFSDGSELSLAAGSQTTVSDLNAHGGHVRIEEGVAHVAIAKKPGAAWSLLAGPYTVRVTGTAFDIGWAGSAQRFDITMQSGSVVITGPLAPGGVTLAAGQHLKADRDLTVERNAPVATAIGSAVPEASAPEEESVAPPTAPSGASKRGGGGHVPSWREQVAHGNFAAVLADAERRGVASTLASANLDDLSALADAARYAREPDLSRRALLAQRQRFAGSAQARDAAFFLGSLSEGQSVALTWYDRYLQESPDGSYASQALGRKLIYVYGQHQAAEARRLATEYSAKYPNGPYASTARKVLAEPLGAGSPPASASTAH